MKTIANMVVFDNDKFLLALLKGYCYAKNIAVTSLEFNRQGIIELTKLIPALALIPIELIKSASKTFEVSLLTQAKITCPIKICGLKKNSTDISLDKTLTWLDMVIDNPSDIGELDSYLKSFFLLNNCLTEKRSLKERRTFMDRREAESKHPERVHYGRQYKFEKPGVKDFRIDYCNKCVFLKTRKVELTPKEFELIELLSTDSEHIFTAEEIINRLWPDSNRATKSDLYQYMHLLRKKIEKDPNNPQWIITIKGFGYKLNIDTSESAPEVLSKLQKTPELDAYLPTNQSTVA